jgi:hypothetical protein
LVFPIRAALVYLEVSGMNTIEAFGYIPFLINEVATLEVYAAFLIADIFHVGVGEVAKDGVLSQTASLAPRVFLFFSSSHAECV